MSDVTKQIINSAKGELIKRGFNIEAWQAKNMRNLLRPESDFARDDGATPEQRERLRVLMSGPDNIRTTRKPRKKPKGSIGKVKPGVGLGRRHINSGRPPKKRSK